MAINKVLIDLEVDGSITSNSFIKASGTSAQFLKADGSIDSSTYLTSETDSQTLSISGVDISISNGNTISIPANTDTVYTLPFATSTVRGGIELFSNTDNPTAANTVTSTASRTYGIQLNAANQAVVNVPWVDTNTDTVYTHPSGDGNLHVIATSTTNNGKVLTAGATAGALTWTDKTVDTNTTYTAGTNMTLTGTVFSSTDTNTVYTHPTTAGNKHIPTGGTVGQILINSASGTVVWGADTDTNTTYTAGANMTLTGTVFSSTDTDTVYSHPTGDGNLHVIATSTTNNGKVLTAGATAGSLTWTDKTTDTNTTYTAGTNMTLTGTVFSSTDTDTVYTHPTTAGNKHIPIGGAAGQFLKYSASGTAVWAADNNTTYDLSGYLLNTTDTWTGTHTTSGLLKFTGTGAGQGIQFNSTTVANDAFGIRVNGTSNAGELEFFSTDDDDEAFVWRHYTTGQDGTGASVEWFRIGAGGNVSALGTVTGSNLSGTNTGDNTVCTSGTATTAVTLANARTINGVSFNGSANITVTANANLAGNLLTAVPAGALFTDTDTVYTHPSGDGNLHVIATSTTNNGKVLTAGATAGSLTWTAKTVNTNTTYVSSDFTHDDLTGFVGNEHIDWTTDQGATNIHANNYINTVYSLPLATDTVRGGIELFSNTDQTVAANTVTTTASRTYGVQLNAANQAVVNVPWVDTNTVYSLPEATATVRGGVELFSNTDQTVAATAVSATASRTYGLQLNAAGQGVINVPWVDTNTTYDLSGYLLNTTDTLTGNLTVTGTTTVQGTGDSSFVGNLGVGTALPGTKLHISDSTGLAFKIERTGASPSAFTTTNASDRITFDYVGGTAGMYWAIEGVTKMQLAENGNVIIQGTTTAVDFILSSDIRLKKDLLPLHSKKLSPTRWTWKESGKKDFGFIAQELEVDFPEIVITGEDGFKRVAYNKITAINAARINELEDSNNKLEDEVSELKRKLELIMQKLEL